MEVVLFYFQVQPLAVEFVLVVISGVHLQLEHIDLILVVNGMRPAQVLIRAVADQTAAGKYAAQHIPPLFTLYMRLIKSHGAFIGLMGINGQARLAGGGGGRIEDNSSGTLCVQEITRVAGTRAE